MCWLIFKFSHDAYKLRSNNDMTRSNSSRKLFQCTLTIVFRLWKHKQQHLRWFLQICHYLHHLCQTIQYAVMLQNVSLLFFLQILYYRQIHCLSVRRMLTRSVKLVSTNMHYRDFGNREPHSWNTLCLHRERAVIYLQV